MAPQQAGLPRPLKPSKGLNESVVGLHQVLIVQDRIPFVMPYVSWRKRPKSLVRWGKANKARALVRAHFKSWKTCYCISVQLNGYSPTVDDQRGGALLANSGIQSLQYPTIPSNSYNCILVWGMETQMSGLLLSGTESLSPLCELVFQVGNFYLAELGLLCRDSILQHLELEQVYGVI